MVKTQNKLTMIMTITAKKKMKNDIMKNITAQTSACSTTLNTPVTAVTSLFSVNTTYNVPRYNKFF